MSTKIKTKFFNQQTVQWKKSVKSNVVYIKKKNCSSLVVHLRLAANNQQGANEVHFRKVELCTELVGKTHFTSLLLGQSGHENCPYGTLLISVWSMKIQTQAKSLRLWEKAGSNYKCLNAATSKLKGRFTQIIQKHFIRLSRWFLKWKWTKFSWEAAKEHFIFQTLHFGVTETNCEDE